MKITGIRDGLAVVGLALLLCFVLLTAFWIADEYHVDQLWVAFAWSSLLMIPFFLRAFRAHLERPRLIPFLAGMAIIHGLVFVGLIKFEVPATYWLPIFVLEGYIGALAASRLFGVAPSADDI